MSVDYYGQAWESRTKIKRLSVTNPFGMPLTETVEVVKSSSDEKIVHGWGPRIQLAMHLAEWGPMRMDAVLQGQFYWLMSSNTISYTGSSPDGNTRSTIKADPYVAQGGAGIRFVWKGD